MRGRDVKLCHSPGNRISLCPHLLVHLSPQTLDKHCVTHLPHLSVDWAWGAGRGCRQEHRERHSAHSCLLTAPGTTAGSPGVQTFQLTHPWVRRPRPRDGRDLLEPGLCPGPRFRGDRGAGAGGWPGCGSSCFRGARASPEVPGRGDRCSPVPWVGASARPSDARIRVLAPPLLPLQPHRTTLGLGVLDGRQGRVLVPASHLVGRTEQNVGKTGARSRGHGRGFTRVICARMSPFGCNDVSISSGQAGQCVMGPRGGPPGLRLQSSRVGVPRLCLGVRVEPPSL